jgi:hypothetical protein
VEAVLPAMEGALCMCGLVCWNTGMTPRRRDVTHQIFGKEPDDLRVKYRAPVGHFGQGDVR